jgi:renalase
MDIDIAIIGAGITGLTCARRLADAGYRPVIIDKGRGIGGRMATRRIHLAGHDLSFDHGAQYFTARDPGFAAFVDRIAGASARWEDGGGEARFVGLPGMSGFPKAIATGLDVRQGVEVIALHREGARWRLETGSEPLVARRLVMTLPAPQAANLLGAHPFRDALARVELAPCLTLMAAFPPEAPRPFLGRRFDNGPLAWIAQDSSKPERNAAMTTWVAQATPEWSENHIEETPETIASRLLPSLSEAIGSRPDVAFHAAAHRWRYARVTKPLGRPFLRDEDATLWLGGDWCLGARVEAGWQSGDAIARDMLTSLAG